MNNLFYHQTRKELETWRRIKVTVAAYAYEFLNIAIMSDEQFDRMCLQINLATATNRPDLDMWFICNFKPDTGQWIHKHPELHKLGDYYETHYNPTRRRALLHELPPAMG